MRSSPTTANVEAHGPPVIDCQSCPSQRTGLETAFNSGGLPASPMIPPTTSSFLYTTAS
jgi:hypothetical protein